MKRKPRHVASRAIEFLPRRFFFVALRETQKLSLHDERSGDDVAEDGGDEVSFPRFPATPGVQYVSLDSQLELESDSSELQRTVRFCDFLTGFLNSSSSDSRSNRIPGSTTSREHTSSAADQVHYFYLRRRSEDAEIQLIHLICRWRLLHLQLSPQEAVAPFEHLAFLFSSVTSSLRVQSAPANPRSSSSHPNLLVSVLGLAKGLEMELLGSNLDDLRLHVNQHSDLGSLENGAMEWITKRLLMFAESASRDPEPALDTAIPTTEVAPHDRDAQVQAQAHKRPVASALASLLKQQQVALVIQLSRQSCDEIQYTECGLEVVDLSSPPPPVESAEQDVHSSSVGDSILLRLLDVCESTRGPVAVHSSGRSALYIGCYLMKHLEFTSQEAFGWLHLCCNTSLTPAHRLALDRLQLRMWRDGDAYRRLVIREANATALAAAAAVHPVSSSMDELLKTSGSLQINIGNISLGRNSLFGTKATSTDGHSGPRTTNSSHELPMLPTAPGDSGHYQYQPHHSEQPSSSAANAVVPQHLKRRPLTQGSGGRHPRLQSYHRNGENGGMDFAQMHKFLHQTGSSVVVVTTPRSGASTNGSSLVSTSNGSLPSVHLGETGRRSPAAGRTPSEIQQ